MLEKSDMLKSASKQAPKEVIEEPAPVEPEAPSEEKKP